MRRFRLRLPVRGIESEGALGRLSGLLSGCPPTGTRPQARAKLGKAEIRSLAPLRKWFSQGFRRFLTAEIQPGDRSACINRSRRTESRWIPSEPDKPCRRVRKAERTVLEPTCAVGWKADGAFLEPTCAVGWKADGAFLDSICAAGWKADGAFLDLVC